MMNRNNCSRSTEVSVDVRRNTQIIPQAFPVRELDEGQTQELVETGKNERLIKLYQLVKTAYVSNVETVVIINKIS